MTATSNQHQEIEEVKPSGSLLKGILIDDDPAFCQLLVSIAQRQGLEIDYYTSVLELELQQLDGAPYDFVLLDYNLGAVDGFEVARSLAGLLGDVPYILISGFELPAECFRTLPRRVVGCLSKSDGLTNLLKFVRAATGGPYVFHTA